MNEQNCTDEEQKVVLLTDEKTCGYLEFPPRIVDKIFRNIEAYDRISLRKTNTIIRETVDSIRPAYKKIVLNLTSGLLDVQFDKDKVTYSKNREGVNDIIYRQRKESLLDGPFIRKAVLDLKSIVGEYGVEANEMRFQIWVDGAHQRFCRALRIIPRGKIEAKFLEISGMTFEQSRSIMNLISGLKLREILLEFRSSQGLFTDFKTFSGLPYWKNIKKCVIDPCLRLQKVLSLDAFHSMDEFDIRTCIFRDTSLEELIQLKNAIFASTTFQSGRIRFYFIKVNAPKDLLFRLNENVQQSCGSETIVHQILNSKDAIVVNWTVYGRAIAVIQFDRKCLY